MRSLTTYKPMALCLLLAGLLASGVADAEIIGEAELGLKIALAKKPSTRPMTLAFLPSNNTYYIADGGLAPLGSDTEAPISKSEIHAYKANGQYINSAKPGFDNRSIYFNPNSGKLETITYNVSSDVGFLPNTGVYGLEVGANGEILELSTEVSQFNPAFGDAGTMPTYDPANKRYYAKQERSNKVFVVDLKQREKLAEITLDLAKAGVAHDDVSDHYVAFTGVAGHELVALDVDHKAVLVFNLKGEYVGKSELPKTMKLRAQNHFNGLGYANNMLFVYHEVEGDFGTYYGFKVLK